jgi:hypothetical protein
MEKNRIQTVFLSFIFPIFEKNVNLKNITVAKIRVLKYFMSYTPLSLLEVFFVTEKQLIEAIEKKQISLQNEKVISISDSNHAILLTLEKDFILLKEHWNPQNQHFLIISKNTLLFWFHFLYIFALIILLYFCFFLLPLYLDFPVELEEIIESEPEPIKSNIPWLSYVTVGGVVGALVLIIIVLLPNDNDFL